MKKIMKKAEMGMQTKPKKGKMISESGDLADALNQYKADEKKGTLPKTDKGAGRYMDDLNNRGKLGPKKPMKLGGTMKKAKVGGSFPDLNKDGKISKADILVGKGVIKAKMGKAVKKCKYGCK